MRTNINIKNNTKVISEMLNDSLFQVVEFESLRGAKNLKTAMGIKYMQDAGVSLKQVKIVLQESGVKLQAGALSYMKGDIKIKNKLGGPVGIGKKLFASKVTGETVVKPTYAGTGEIYLENSFGHYALLELDDEEIVVDDGLFLACEDTVKVDITMMNSVSSMVLGGEGLFQLKLSGSGIVVLEMPVPETEIVRIKLFNDRLAVDGDLVVLRSGSVDFTVEKSGSTLIGSAINGEGLVNVYEGVGEVWLLPTRDVYDEIEETVFFDKEAEEPTEKE